MNDLLTSLPWDGSSCSREAARDAIIKLLRAVEKKPLRSKDLNTMKESIAETIKAFNLAEDSSLLAVIDKRCSFEFIPGISSLGLENSSESELNAEDISVQLRMEANTSNGKNDSGGAASMTGVGSMSGTSLGVDDILGKYGNKRIYFLCSVRRQQTALWTSYRLFLDGTREFDSCGQLSIPTMYDQPMSLLGAKKFKSGVGAQSLIWDVPDTKQWKDKNAIGRLTRLPNAIYSGVPFTSSSNISNVQPSMSPLPFASAVGGDSEFVASESNSRALSPADRAHGSTESIGSASAHAVVDDLNPSQITRSRSASKMWNFMGTPATSPTAVSAGNNFGSNNSNGGGFMNPQSGAVSLACDGGIVLSVVCKGMDKLIYLNGVAQRNSGNEGADCVNFPMTEVYLQSKLDALLRKEISPDTFSNENLILLRSKLPRKTPSAGGKTTHTVAFSKINRVGISSRKNIVVDMITKNSSIDAAECAAEWADESALPALLQFGKRDEGLFTLDFYDLTPFQVNTD